MRNRDWSRAEGRDENSRSGDKTEARQRREPSRESEQRRDENRAETDERLREKFLAMNVKCASRNSLERSALSARGNDCLTPLTREARARNCARRAHEQSRLRGAAIDSGALTMCRVVKGAYTRNSLKMLCLMKNDSDAIPSQLAGLS